MPGEIEPRGTCPACEAILSEGASCGSCEWTRPPGPVRGWESGVLEQILSQLPVMDSSALMELLGGVRREARSRRAGGVA